MVHNLERSRRLFQSVPTSGSMPSSRYQIHISYSLQIGLRTGIHLNRGKRNTADNFTVDMGKSSGQIPRGVPGDAVCNL